VHQHQGALPFAAQLVAQPYPVQFNEIHFLRFSRFLFMVIDGAAGYRNIFLALFSRTADSAFGRRTRDALCWSLIVMNKRSGVDARSY
jgi:hypothetical protein